MRFQDQKAFHEHTDSNRFWTRMGNPFLIRKEKKLAELTMNYLQNNNNSLLEVGCGEGSNLAYLREQMPDAMLVGLDFSFNKISFMKKSNVNALGVCCDATYLPFKPAQFDLIVLRDLLHHINWQRGAALEEAMVALKTDGVIIVFESNGRKLLNRIFQLIVPEERGMIDSTEEKLYELGSRYGIANIDYVEASFLIRAINYLLGWPGIFRYLFYPVYKAAFLWEVIYEKLAPKQKWTYMMMSIKRN